MFFRLIDILIKIEMQQSLILTTLQTFLYDKTDI